MTGAGPQLAAALGSVAALLAAVAAVRAAGAAWGWLPEVQRKAVHLLTGLYALTFPVLFADRWPVVLLVAGSLLAMLVLRRPGVAGAGIGAALHGVGRRSWGDLLLALAIGFVFLRSRGQPILYTLPVAVVTLSDAAAALAGSTYGRRLFRVEAGTKSLEGVAVFFLVTWIVAMVMLLLFTDVPRANVVAVSLAVAVFGALVEAYSWRGFDNLFVPVGLHLFLEGYLRAPPLPLLGVALAFFASIGLALAFAPALGLTRHAARAYTAALFLVAGVSGAAAALLPAAAIGAHLHARARRPCRSPYPDLDLLAMLVGTALVWLIVGESVGPSAVNFFGLTFAGAVLVYTGVACGRRPVPVAAMAVGLLALHAAVVAVSAPEKRWHGDLLPVAALSLLLCAAVAWAWPGWFDRWRAPRAAGVAVAVPFAWYALKALA